MMQLCVIILLAGMQLCRGGELVRRIGRRHYSERTVRTPAELCSFAACAPTFFW